MKDYSILHDFVKTLKENGFRVFTSDSNENYSYCHFTRGNKIGYVQCDYFGGLTFGTVHKPCKENGTGFGLDFGQEDRRVWEPTIEHAEECFIVYPYWAKHKDSIKKYKDWEEFSNKSYSEQKEL